MYYTGNEPVRKNLNQQKKSQKNNNIFQPNIKINQSPSQQYQNYAYNNGINYNLMGNKLKNQPKGQVIEGDLNFNNNNNNIKRINHNKISNNSKSKKNRNKPRKSPIPVPKDYKPSNFQFQKLFGNNFHIPNSNIMKPKSSIPRKNNFVINNINKNSFKSNILGINSNFPSNKTYNTFNIFKKDLERTHSPLLRSSGTNNGINFMQKGAIKSRYISKSPILSKGSIFNRYKMYGFGSSSNNTSTSSTSNNQKKKKKTPIKNNQKKIQVIPKANNINNLRAKGTTLISGEFVQDSTNKGKFNINNINRIQNQNNDMINIKPVYNPKNLQIESNNSLLNIQPVPNKEKEEEKNKNKDNFKDNNININNKKNIDKLNNDNETEKKINENRNEEVKKNNQRSLSQGINPLIKSAKEGKKELKEKEDKITIVKIKKDQTEKVIENEKNNHEKKVIKKKIKDILPFTHVGFDGEEPKENNQDIYFIYKNFMNHKDYIYMSVCDGHGVEGHFVSDFIKEILPYDMSEQLKHIDILSESSKEKAHQIIKSTFIQANEKLVDNEEINSLFSGSTCVSVIYTPERLIVPNIGDSRAVLGRLINKEKNEYKAINLSRDHKPTEKDEAQRIIENDGRIQPFIEDGEFVGPERVWIKEDEVPGLAMTRSFGDRVAATVGVMSEPEIKEFNFEEGDKFMIIASDGIWEFISSQECVDIIKDFYDKNDLKGCCEYLYQESSKRWLKEEEVIDDTTLILVFFE